MRFVFRHFPVPELHPHAERAAEAAEAAAAQGRFSEMHDLLIERQDPLDDAHLVGYAEQIGLDVERFRADLGARELADRVREDRESGERSGVNATPKFYVNGVRHDGRGPTSAVEAAVAREGAGR